MLQRKTQLLVQKLLKKQGQANYEEQFISPKCHLGSRLQSWEIQLE